MISEALGFTLIVALLFAPVVAFAVYLVVQFMRRRSIDRVGITTERMNTPDGGLATEAPVTMTPNEPIGIDDVPPGTGIEDDERKVA